MLKRLISELLGEITMTLIVELMTFNDPFMMIDSVLESSESQNNIFNYYPSIIQQGHLLSENLCLEMASSMTLMDALRLQ